MQSRVRKRTARLHFHDWVKATFPCELPSIREIASQTLGYYRENAAASSASIGEIVLHAIKIYEPRCTANGIEIKKGQWCGAPRIEGATKCGELSGFYPKDAGDFGTVR